MGIGSIVKIIKDCEFKNKLTIITKCIGSDKCMLYIDRSTGVWDKSDIENVKMLKNKDVMRKIMEENERNSWK